MVRRLLIVLGFAAGLLVFGAVAASADSIQDRIEQHRGEVKAKIHCQRLEMRGESCAPAAPQQQQAQPQAAPAPAPSGGPKRIEISISEQRLRAYEGDREVMSAPVSTGTSSTPTPTGSFTVLSKETNHWSSKYGVWMPHAMRFYKGYFIHALPVTPDGRTIGASSLGRPASHGCVRLAPDDARALFAWASVGTPVHVRH